jgi:hypothetical protein
MRGAIHHGPDVAHLYGNGEPTGRPVSRIM